MSNEHRKCRRGLIKRGLCIDAFANGDKISDDGDIKRYNNLRESNILSPALTQWPSLKLIIFHFLSMKRLCVHGKQKGRESVAFHRRQINIGTSLRTSIQLHYMENWIDVSCFLQFRQCLPSTNLNGIQIIRSTRDIVQMLLFYSSGEFSFIPKRQK